MKPLCFVLMPFGVKQYGNVTFNFDDVYNDLIKVAIEAAGLEPIRADEEQVDGIIHKPMYERLVLCEYAVADLSGANANVFYELGVRHAFKPHTTALIFADSTRLPFDVSPLRAMPYSIDENGKLTHLKEDIEKLTKKLLHAKEEQSSDSPLFQLLEDYPNINHSKTDVFRDQVDYSEKLKGELLQIRDSKTSNSDKQEKLSEFENKLGEHKDIEAGVLIDLLLSYRSLGSKEFLPPYMSIVDLVEKLPKPVKNTVLVQEQFGFALNRVGEDVRAANVLEELIDNRGGSSETFGILGRVYKDRWLKEKEAGNAIIAKGALKKAVKKYVEGFESDIRDAYPGVNAVTLMTILNPNDPEIKVLLPVVRYAVLRKMSNKEADYWDHATLFELEVLGEDNEAALEHLEAAMNSSTLFAWMIETTLDNFKLIIEAKAGFGQNVDELNEFAEALKSKMDELAS